MARLALAAALIAAGLALAVAPAEAQGPGRPPGAGPASAPLRALSCATCHGQDGIGTSPLFPNLAGQKALYLVKVLREYRAGRRADPVMTVAAKDLTDEEIDSLAEYYERLGRRPAD